MSSATGSSSRGQERTTAPFPFRREAGTPYSSVDLSAESPVPTVTPPGPTPTTAGPLPAGVLAAAAFFALSGIVDAALTVAELPKPLAFWPVWQALGGGLLYLLLAAGLLHRFAVCRSLAMVYCLASLVTYAVVLLMAFGQAPVAFPTSVMIQSLVEVPSCALLLPYLRSSEAASFLRRPLL